MGPMGNDGTVEGGALPPTSRFAQLQEQAKALNHELRILLIPGKLVNGMPVRLRKLGPAETLSSQLDEIAAYLGTDEAKARGELYKRKEQADEDFALKWAEYITAQLAVREIERELDADTDASIQAGDDAGDEDIPF